MLDFLKKLVKNKLDQNKDQNENKIIVNDNDLANSKPGFDFPSFLTNLKNKIKNPNVKKIDADVLSNTNNNVVASLEETTNNNNEQEEVKLETVSLDEISNNNEQEEVKLETVSLDEISNNNEQEEVKLETNTEVTTEAITENTNNNVVASLEETTNNNEQEEINAEIKPEIDNETITENTNNNETVSLDEISNNNEQEEINTEIKLEIDNETITENTNNNETVSLDEISNNNEQEEINTEIKLEVDNETITENTNNNETVSLEENKPLTPAEVALAKSNKNFFDELKEKFTAQINYWQVMFKLLKKEHKGEKVDKFSLTEELIKTSNQNLSALGENVSNKNASNVKNVFGITEENEQDILETILKQKQEVKPNKIVTEKQKPEVEVTETIEGVKRYSLNKDDEEEEIEYINPFVKYLDFLYGVAMLSVFILLSTWLFFFIQLDPNNNIISTFVPEQKNMFQEEKSLMETADTLKKEIKEVDTKIAKLKNDTNEIPAQIALDEISLSKFDWLQIRRNLYEATSNAFKYNDDLNYITYDSFAGDGVKSTISISGSIVNPLGRVFSMQADLINAFNNHPCFSGAEIKSFSKTKNKDEEIGGFMTTFSLTLNYEGFKNSAKCLDQNL